jgi:hypothetical protein
LIDAATSKLFTDPSISVFDHKGALCAPRNSIEPIRTFEVTKKGKNARGM